MTKLKAVMFDLDETLLNRTKSLRKFVADQRGRFPVLQEIEQHALQDMFVHFDRRGTVSKMLVYEQILATISVEDTGLTAALFADYEENFWRFAEPFSGFSDLFAGLREAGLGTAIITNGQTHIQLRSLLALNLDRLADAYLISEMEKLRKPDPEIFHRAAKRLNVEPEVCAFVGDNPLADIIGALKCGMKTIWFPNGAVWPEDTDCTPDVTISSLSEVLPLIRNWN